MLAQKLSLLSRSSNLLKLLLSVWGITLLLPIYTCSPYQLIRAAFPSLSKLPLHTENQLATNSKMTLLAQNIACLVKVATISSYWNSCSKRTNCCFAVAVAVVATEDAAEAAVAAAAAGNGSFALKMSRGYVFFGEVVKGLVQKP